MGEKSSTNAIEKKEIPGRFRKGNPGGPGNPLASQVNKLRVVLHQRLTPEAMARVWDTALSLAEGGDMAAIRLIVEYAYGRPQQSVEVTGAGGGPIQVTRVSFLELLPADMEAGK